MTSGKADMLTVPLIVDLSPKHKLEDIKNGWIGNYGSYWGSFGLVTREDGITRLSRIGETQFHMGPRETAENEDTILTEIGSLPEKLSADLINKGLDLFIDIPLAHRCKITRIFRNKVTFSSELEPLAFDKIPRHTEQSYLWRSRRRGIEAAMNAKIKCPFGREILQTVRPEDLSRLSFETFNENDQQISGSGDLIGMQREHTFAIDRYNMKSLLIIGGNTIIGDRISIQGNFPISYVSSLPGQKASTLIDNDVFQKIRITDARQEQGSLTVRLAFPEAENQTLLELFPEALPEALEKVIEEERKSLPPEVAAWDEYLAENDAERYAKPELNVLTCHLYRTTNGRNRYFGTENDAI